MRKGEVVAVFQSYEPPHQTSVRQHCNVLESWDAVSTGKNFLLFFCCVYMRLLKWLFCSSRTFKCPRIVVDCVKKCQAVILVSKASVSLVWVFFFSLKALLFLFSCFKIFFPLLFTLAYLFFTSLFLFPLLLKVLCFLPLRFACYYVLFC